MKRITVAEVAEMDVNRSGAVRENRLQSLARGAESGRSGQSGARSFAPLFRPCPTSARMAARSDSRVVGHFEFCVTTADVAHGTIPSYGPDSKKPRRSGAFSWPPTSLLSPVSEPAPLTRGLSSPPKR